MALPPAEGRAAAGAEAVARATADCIVAGCQRKWGSARALESGSAGGRGVERETKKKRK